MQRQVTMGFGIATVVTATAILGSTLLAQSQGEVVQFITDNATAEMIVCDQRHGGACTGTPGDVVVFAGRSLGVVHVGDCAAGDRHLQPVVLIDPGEERAARGRWVYVTSQETPIRSGTRLGNLVVLDSCAGGTYVKFQGTVE